MRSLHDFMGRRTGAFLHCLCGPSQWRGYRDRGRSGAEPNRSSSDSGGLLEGTRSSMRLLHTGISAYSKSAAPGPSEAQRAGNSRLDQWQSVSMHRLSEHRNRRSTGGGEAGRTQWINWPVGFKGLDLRVRQKKLWLMSVVE